jgi:hypothetical protein
MRYKIILIIFINNDLAFLKANKWGHKHKFLNLGSNIKKWCYEPFFFIFFSQIILKNTSKVFSNVKSKKSNSRITMDFSSTQSSKETKIHVCTFNFKQMDMVEFKALLNNQWPLDWLKTQENATNERTT